MPEPKQTGQTSFDWSGAFAGDTALRAEFACLVGMKIGEVERIIALGIGESSFAKFRCTFAIDDRGMRREHQWGTKYRCAIFTFS